MQSSAPPADAAPAEVDEDVLAQIALSRDEYERACDMLGRAPSDVELGMIGALWSEHCGYKHSRPLFHHFPTEDERILTNLGEENAGAIDIGDGWVAVMKIESHNHPSAIEPYEGAATGVGGIVRDIFAMGAQPIALLDSLRFGPLEDRRNRRLCVGVVAGIGGYGNCLGIPTVGGELVVGDSYSGNPLVNAMCLGIAPRGALISATAGPPGTRLMIVGADTGRDGLHGATFASVELDESSAERRPAVQVGNPFLEKSLMDACVGLVREHRDWLEGLQDCGAAGITSSTVEMAERARSGIRIQTQQVPRRESGMTPYEVMLSESQERMIAAVKPEHVSDVQTWFEHWDLHAEVIGEVTSDGIARVFDGEAEVAAAPVSVMTSRAFVHASGRAGRRRQRSCRLGSCLACRPGARRGERCTAEAAGVAQHRFQALGVSAVRPHGWDQYRGGAGLGRGRVADSWTAAGAGALHGRSGASGGAGPVCGRRSCGGRGGSQRCLHGGSTGGGDRLPELCQS